MWFEKFNTFFSPFANDSGVDEHVLLECVSFLESTLDNSVSKVALGHFYTQKAGKRFYLLVQINNSYVNSYVRDNDQGTHHL